MVDYHLLMRSHCIYGYVSQKIFNEAYKGVPERQDGFFRRP